MSFKCELVELSSQLAMSIRTRTTVQDLPQLFANGLGAIAQYLGELNEQPAGPPFAIYYNMDMQDLDVEIGFPVSITHPGRSNIQASETPSGKSAACLHVGPYSDVEPTYNALFQWIKDNGYEATGVAYEIYLNDPDETPPEKLETQIYLPVTIEK